jgi:hypothetical protein
VAPRPLCRVLCKKLKNYFPKIYIGRGPISKHSTPRVSTIPQTNNKHTSQPPTPNSKIASGSLHRKTMCLLAHINATSLVYRMHVGLIPKTSKIKTNYSVCPGVGQSICVNNHGLYYLDVPVVSNPKDWVVLQRRWKWNVASKCLLIPSSFWILRQHNSNGKFSVDSQILLGVLAL